MAERTPNGRTSYDAAATTPRGAGPPTIRGCPRSAELALLDRREERVHVDVEDGARRHGAWNCSPPRGGVRVRDERRDACVRAHAPGGTVQRRAARAARVTVARPMFGEVR